MRLKSDGYETVYAANALEAILLARQTKPDLIVLDFGIPGSSGVLVLERLEAVSRLASIPVVIVTAEEPMVAQAKTLAAGAVAFLYKPVVRYTVVKTVKEAWALSHKVPRNVTQGDVMMFGYGTRVFPAGSTRLSPCHE